MRKRRKFNHGADLEAQLRGYRATPTDEFVDRLSQSIAAKRRAPERAWSRLAFASAVSVFMLGTFASFGGLSYAASGASGTYHAVKQVASGKLLVSVKKSSAADEYGKTPPKPPAATVGGVQKTLGAGVKSGGTLPFTGLSLLTTFFISLALIVAGLALRRRERRN